MPYHYLPLRTMYPAALLVLLACLAGCRDNPVNAPAATGTSPDPTVSENETAGKNFSSPFDEAEVYFEYNTTDNDLGFQLFLDAEGWDKVSVADPDNHKVVQVNTQGTLSELGITELRFESAEPSPDEVLSLFPPGDYIFTGKTVEGDFLMSEAELSHVFVDAFTFSPSDGALVDPSNTTVTWDAPGAELVEVILENEDNDNVFDIIVEGDAGSLDIPPQFMDAGITYKIELLAYHENGNRTIVESTFSTMP